MPVITNDHFGANIVLTKSSAAEGSPFQEMLREISFSQFRYPGGTITEQQTWENGGLDRVFGPPMEPDDENHVMTLGEALNLAEDQNSAMTIVIPTFQFFDTASGSFTTSAFERYLSKLEDAIVQHPHVRISGFEIGNEYWAGLTPSEYGIVANNQIPRLHELNNSLSDKLGGEWEPADIGIQAGNGWRDSGANESREIAAEISVENRSFVKAIYQHIYPNPSIDLEMQLDRALDPMKVFDEMEGFSSNLKHKISEFNIHQGDTGEDFYGINQGAIWIEEFSRYIDAGVDTVDSWGINYKWLSTKFYDAQLPPAERDNGEIVTKATPMGQIYDLAQSHLPGMSTLSDEEATAGLTVTGDLGVTGFADETQQMVFFSNRSGECARIDIGADFERKLVHIHHLIAADSPHSPSTDESVLALDEGVILDARGDMNVTTFEDLDQGIEIGDNQIIALLVSDPHADLVLEGAHHVTDDRTEFVNDHLTGGAGRDILRGHVGNDTLSGGDSGDVLRGGRGEDSLNGNEGNDILISTRGGDTLSGDNGDDLFLIEPSVEDEQVTLSLGEGQDVIAVNGGRDVVVTDFNHESDALILGNQFADSTELQAATEIRDEDIVVTLPDGSRLTLSDAGAQEFELTETILDLWDQGVAQEYFGDLLSIMTPQQYDEINVKVTDHPVLDWLMRPDTRPSEEPGPPDTPDPDPPESNRPLSALAKPEEPNPWDIPEEEEEEDPAQAQSGSSCFVATAVYGDIHHPDVISLRTFRDNHLRNCLGGRLFIRAYYRIGPSVALVFTPGSPQSRFGHYLLSKFVRWIRSRDLTD